MSSLHKADAVTASLSRTYQVPRPAHSLQKQRLQAHSTDEGAEAQSCAHLVTILQCFPRALRVEQSPCLWVLPPPAPHCHYNIHSLSTHWAHTCPRPVLGFPLIMLALLLFPHHLVSVAMPPLPGSAPLPTPTGSDYWGNSQQINIPLCTALVVLYCQAYFHIPRPYCS